jgi:4'-phosphopantetheinyl transferase
LVISNLDVHLWLVAIDQLDGSLSRLSRMLSEDEFSRAESFYFDVDRKRFITRRGLLRIILSFYIGINPKEIQFSYGSYGKPYLSTELDNGNIQFSLSHSDGLAIYAFTRGCRIGLDMEAMKELPDVEYIVACFFSPRENAIFRQLAPKLQQERFLQWWTRKEAYLKATGEGLTHPLNMVDIALGPDEPTQLLHPGAHSKGSDWSLKVLSPAKHYVAAVVVESQKFNLSCWHWQPSI